MILLNHSRYWFGFKYGNTHIISYKYNFYCNTFQERYEQIVLCLSEWQYKRFMLKDAEYLMYNTRRHTKYYLYWEEDAFFLLDYGLTWIFSPARK